MTPKRASRIAAFVTLGAVGVVSFGRAAIAGFWDLLINAPFLTALLGAPLAAAAGILTYRWRTVTDSPETDVARSSDEWIAAVRSELAAVKDPRERRHFARAVVVVVVVRRTLTAWTWLLAGCVAVTLALGLLALSRARVGDGVGDFTVFVPPLVFFAVGAVAAKRLGSFSRGLVVAAAVAALSAVAMLPVAATEAAHLYSEAGVSRRPGGGPGRPNGPPGPGPYAGGSPPPLLSVPPSESSAACWRPGWGRFSAGWRLWRLAGGCDSGPARTPGPGGVGRWESDAPPAS